MERNERVNKAAKVVAEKPDIRRCSEMFVLLV